eukprot:jgi/Tetstr1/462430/TSEL_007428.t1
MIGRRPAALRPRRGTASRGSPHGRRLDYGRVSAAAHGRYGDAELLEMADSADGADGTPPRLAELMAAARDLRDSGPHAGVVSFSPKVFIPVTRLCRDSCGYCTFAQPPTGGRRAYMTVEEAVAVAAAGAAAGCTEALLTLGDKPELAYPEAAAELAELGHEDTLSYVAEVAAAVASSTGLLPHVNAGVMGRAELAALRQVSASQGMMLESSSSRLAEPGGPHHDCPDKDAAARLATIRAAGQEAVPFTTGLLIGIGETRAERVADMLSLRDIHAEHGHIQEIIIQNFVPKPGTAMADCAPPSLDELLWTVAVARLVFGPDMSIQAPPNLSPDEMADGAPGAWRALLDAGINDWGGVSPLTLDWVNPERPWPAVEALAAATADAGAVLVPRLTVYPSYARDVGRWLDGGGGVFGMAGMTRAAMDGAGWARGSAWFAGQKDATDTIPVAISSGAAGQGDGSTSGQPQRKKETLPAPGGLRRGAGWTVETGADGLLLGCGGVEAVSAWVRETIAAVEGTGHALTEGEMARLFTVRGADFDAVCAAADRLRAAECGDSVAYVVNRNINYTNVCTFKCTFCAFSKGPAEEALRGKPYVVPLEEVTRRTAEAWERGATEVCMQGGIHPEFTGDTYLRLLAAAKAGAPDIHVHAFSPLEVAQGAATLGCSAPAFLTQLQSAGLGSLPGTAAEVLDDSVRQVLCPDKLTSDEWCDIVMAAHDVGLPTTSTIMFGHTDTYASWAAHMARLRAVQASTGGFTELVPLAFVHMEAPLYRRGLARRGPTLREAILMHAVARLAKLGIPNIQASWVKMGEKHAAQLLSAGANDMGGVLMNESITRAAGAEHGQEVSARRMEELIHGAGRAPRQRTTLYEDAPAEQVARALATSGRQLEAVLTAPAASPLAL